MPYQIVATDGSTQTVVPAAGETVTVLFPQDTVGNSLLAVGAVKNYTGDNSKIVITLDGSDGSMTVQWQESSGISAPGHPPPPTTSHQMTINASAAARPSVGNSNIAKTLKIVPRGATVGLSAVAKLAIGASVVAVGAVGVVAANRTATGSAIAAEARENIRRSRV